MTPQPRHIEAARAIVRSMQASYHVSPKINHPPFDPYEAIAIALAEAENRAAWEGYDFGFGVAESVERCLDNSADRLNREIAETYGPRPTKENQP